MARKSDIRLRRSATAGSVPTTSQLNLGELAINTYDGKLFLKKSVSGTETVVEIGADSGSQQTAIYKEYVYTASSNQTSFSGSDDNSQTLSYVVGYLQVFLNGVLLDNGTDYTATTGNTIVLVNAASSGDLVQISTFVKVLGTGDMVTNAFTGNGSTAAYTLTANPGSEENTLVYVDGVYQEKDTYTVSGTTLTFDANVANGASIEVVIGSKNVSTLDAADLDISGDLYLDDNKKVKLGDSGDLNVYHSGSHSYIENYTGDLVLLNAADDKDIIFQSDDGSGGTTTYFYLDGSQSNTNFQKDIIFADNKRALFGGSGDLRIYHNGSNSYIQEAGTGELLVQSNTVAIQNAAGTENMAKFIQDGAVQLYHDDAIKLVTKSDGVDITGELQSDSLDVDGAADIQGNLTVGGTAAITGNTTITGNLTVEGTTTTLNTATLDVEDKNITLNYGSGDTSSSADGAGITIQDAVNSSTDATILWNASSDQFDFSHHIKVPDSKYLKMGDDNDFIIYHDGTTNYIQAVKQDSDIIFRGNDGGTNFNAMAIDMSAGGLVGIGTTSPGALLELNSDGSNADGAVLLLKHANNNSTDVISTIKFANNAGTAAMIQAGTTGANNTSYINFFTENSGTSSEKMRILANGNVGIGTYTPGFKLDVVDAGTQLGSTGYYANARFKDSDNVGVMLGHNNTSNGVGMIAGINKLAFLTYGTSWGERMRIDHNKVGIGDLSFTSATAAPLHVAKSNTDVQAIFGDNNTTIDDPEIRIIGRDSSNTAARYTYLGLDADANYGFVGYNAGSGSLIKALYLNTSGNVGIGASPSVALDIGSKTDAIRVPNGTTAQRPTAALGQIRYNTTTSEFEGYAAGAWGKIGGGGDSFGTIAVSGQSNVVAEQENDTLTLVGQNGVSITTDASSDTVTIDGRTSYSPFTTDLFTTANASTTDFVLSVTPSSEDNLIVFLEGVYQNKNSYTLSSNTLTLDSAPASGEEVVVHIVSDLISGQALVRNNFTGDGSTTAFTTTIAPMNENNTFVYFDGVYQEKSEYSVSGTTLTFTSAPANGDSIEVIIPKTTELQQPATGSIDDIAMFDNTALIGNQLTSTTVASTSATTIATHAVATYRSVNYQVQCTQGTDYHVTNISIVHDGTTAYMTEYGAVFDNAALGTFDATISSGNLLLQITAGSATSMAVKVVSTAIPV